nr:hypothetical protein [Tanacetum cinerariifolium]
MNYLEEQTDGEAMINSIKNDDQPLSRVTQVSIAGISSNEQPPLKDKSMLSDQEKRIQKFDHLAISLLIQGLLNDIYSLIDSNKTAKDLWDALARHMLGSEYGEQDRKAAVLYEYEMFKATEGQESKAEDQAWMESSSDSDLMDINIDALYNILKQNQGDVNDAMGSKKKTVVVTFDPLALIAEKTYSEGSEADDFTELKKITALLAKVFNQRNFYSKPTNNNLRTSSTSQSANKKQEFVKTDDKKEDKKADEKRRDMSRVKCYNCKKEGHFAKDCKKAKVKDYEYYKTKMLLAKKDKDEQVLLAEEQVWMESIKASSLSADEKIYEVSYYLSEYESESEFETLEYYDNSTDYGLFMNNDDDQEIFPDAIESASENFIENHIDSQKDYDKFDVLKNQLQVKHVVIDTHAECQEKYAKLEAERYEYMIRDSAYFDNDKQHRKQIVDQEVLKGIGFENPSYFEKAKDLRPTLYDEKVIGLGYTLMFLTHSDEALEIEKFKRSRENKTEFVYDYANLNANYVNEKINFEDDYFQDIINLDFEKIDSLFQQASSIKTYVPNVILEKIIIDLEDEVVNLLEKEKENLETIESLKSKGVESSETVISESENQSENACLVVEK